MFPISWESLPAVAVPVSIHHPKLFRRHHCYLFRSFLISQTISIGFLPSSTLYLLVYLQPKTFLPSPHLNSRTIIFLNR